MAARPNWTGRALRAGSMAPGPWRTTRAHRAAGDQGFCGRDPTRTGLAVPTCGRRMVVEFVSKRTDTGGLLALGRCGVLAGSGDCSPVRLSVKSADS